ncbi:MULTISPECIES: ParD-like family protein [Shewanella]|uniref:ParD-like family protein n=2 Tax=Shewanella TaxID=22 RepID=A0A974XJQ5_9GAMM|nr:MULTISPECIES: ParD-like family protein [Shewanella]QSX29661.1 ParD-like family protein [Shewanella cyperi]QSX36834.1 ParD-like family protein [Shewanella sedimentimangrovi]QSX40443.1 ParD-like family protein [Shewanella cyperi]
MGIVKISDELHEELRKASGVMARSINAQAEFWIKMGMLAELNPGKTYGELIQDLYRQEAVTVPGSHSVDA